MRSPLKAKNRCAQQAQNTVPGWIEFVTGTLGVYLEVWKSLLTVLN